MASINDTNPIIVDPTRAFFDIPEVASRCYTTGLISDTYAYGIQPMKTSGTIITAEREEVPVLTILDENGSPLSVKAVHSDYIGISSPQVVGNLCFFITYHTEPGAPSSKLRWWDISEPSAMREVGSLEMDLGETVLRVYDLGVVRRLDGHVVVVRALVRDEKSGLHSEKSFLFYKKGDQICAAGALNLLSSYNELRSIALFEDVGGAIYCIANRRYWLKNQSYLFELFPEEKLLAQRKFACKLGDFQQVGVVAEDERRISLTCLHRQRKDDLGIHYNIEEFR